jgi:hypothetical protein
MMHTCLQDGVEDLTVHSALCNQERLSVIPLIVVIFSLLVRSRSCRISSWIWLLDQSARKAQQASKTARKVMKPCMLEAVG